MRSLVTLSLALWLAATPAPGSAIDAAGSPSDAERGSETPHAFDALVKRLDAAIKANEMFAVTRASASAGASRRGIAIAGNLVVGVFRNDFAVRMLEASVPAGIEAPLRFYVTGNADGTATLSYRVPSAVFGPYGGAGLDEMAKELDAIFDSIAAAAAGE